MVSSKAEFLGGTNAASPTFLTVTRTVTLGSFGPQPGSATVLTADDREVRLGRGRRCRPGRQGGGWARRRGRGGTEQLAAGPSSAGARRLGRGLGVVGTAGDGRSRAAAGGLGIAGGAERAAFGGVAAVTDPFGRTSTVRLRTLSP